MKQIKSQNQPWSHVLMGKFTLKCAHYTVVVFYCWGSLLLQWQQWSLPMMTSPVWHVPLWTALCPSARSSPHLPQSSVCCVGTQQLFAVSVVYYLSSHSCSCHSHLYAAWSGHTQQLFVVSVVYYLPGHCPTCHSHLYASWSHTAAVCGEYYVLIDCHRVLQTSMGNPWSWGILGQSLCQMMNKWWTEAQIERAEKRDKQTVRWWCIHYLLI